MIKNAYICSSFNGCVLNSYLLSRINDFLVGNGINVTDSPDKSEAVIIGTCANVDSDEKKALNTVKRYIKRYGARKKIIVTGCLPDINPGFFKKNSGVIGVGAKGIGRLDRIFNARHSIRQFQLNNLNERFCVDEDVPDESHYQYYAPEKYYIEISRGCLNNCSYCAIKKAKGSLQSRPLRALLSEFRKGVKLGFKKFVLLGDECGGYGRDIGTSFAELLLAIGRARGDFEIVISNLEPSRLLDMRPFLKDILSRVRISYINLPLQSGNQRVLKLMNRRYSAREVVELVKEIKKTSPRTRFETNIIYGFPSERRNEFMDSVRMARHFDIVSFFIYSERSGTPAAKLDAAVSRREIAHRTGILKKLRVREPQKYFFADMKILPQGKVCKKARIA
jgi:MiaB/RimO family radical SAM methylthiotransferase